jgi:hypothetical protein
MTASFGMTDLRSKGSDTWNCFANSTMDPRSLTKDFREFLQCLNESGVDYLPGRDCQPRGIQADLDGVRVRFISREDLKANKRASGRNKDLADLDQLP